MSRNPSPSWAQVHKNSKRMLRRTEPGDSLGEALCRILEERRPGSRWTYYRDQRLVPEGVTFFYVSEALRKMWGEGPGTLIRRSRRRTAG
jgi:hypothetical protein